MGNMGYRLALKAKTPPRRWRWGAEFGEPERLWAVLPLCWTGSLTKFQGENLWREYRKPGTEDFDDGVQAPGSSVSYFAPQLFTTDFTPLPLPDAGARRRGVDDGGSEGDDEQEPTIEDDETDTALMRPQVGRDHHRSVAADRL